jgi:hypothetical protein
MGRLPVQKAELCSPAVPTGIQSDTLIADMLMLADALALIDQRFGRHLLKGAGNDDLCTTLRSHLGDRAYLAEILEGRASNHELSFRCIVDIVSAAAQQ